MKKKSSRKPGKKTLKKTSSQKPSKKTLKKKPGTIASLKKTRKMKAQKEQNKPAGKKVEDETTEIICVLDRSTSIRTSNLIEKTIEGFNSFLAEQKNLPGKARLTLCLFDGGSGYGNTGVPGETYEIRYSGIDIKDVAELNKETFVPKGMTAMYDAIGMTIDNVAKRIAEAKKEDCPDKIIFLIMTDGAENSSKEYTQKIVFDSIKKYKEEKNWAFVFIGANIDTMQAGYGIGVSGGNTLSYGNSAKGVAGAYGAMGVMTSNFRAMSSTSSNFSTAANNLVVDNVSEKEKEELVK